MLPLAHAGRASGWGVGDDMSLWSWWRDGLTGRGFERTGDPDLDERARSMHRRGQIAGDVIHGTDHSGLGIGVPQAVPAEPSSGGSSDGGLGILLVIGLLFVVWLIVQYTDQILIFLIGLMLAWAIGSASRDDEDPIRLSTVFLTMAVLTAMLEWAYFLSPLRRSDLAGWAWDHPLWAALSFAGLFFASCTLCLLADQGIDWLAKDGNWRRRPVLLSALALAAALTAAAYLTANPPRTTVHAASPAKPRVEAKTPMRVAAKPQAATPASPVGRTAVVTAKTRLALRGGPSLAFDPPIDWALSGETLEVVGFEDGWYEVKDAAGRRLFASAQFLRLLDR